MKFTAALFGIVPALAFAGNFDGTWVADVTTLKTVGKPETYLVADGMFRCDMCYPGLNIKADGTDQKVTGHAYYDTASAKIIDGRRVEMTASANGKPYAFRNFTVAVDGKTMMEESIVYDGTKPTKAKFSYVRVADALPGAHPLSGSWQVQAGANSISPEALTMTLKDTPQGFSMNSATGQSYDAQFDGKQYPIVGDSGKTTVSLKRINSRTIEETDTRAGQVTDVEVFKLSPDGKVLFGTDDDKLHGQTTTFTAAKKTP